MTAWLSARAPLVARSTSLSIGAIVGATIGSVLGAVLVILCVLPFILRARRLRAYRRKHGKDATIEEFGQPDFLSRSHIGDAIRRLSHSTPSQPPPKIYAAGDGQDSTDQNQEVVEKPQATLYPAGVNVHYGLPSPITPPLPAALRFEPPPGRALQDGRTATGSLTLATQTTQDSIPTQPLSQDQTMTDMGTNSKKPSISDSFASPSRQGTFGSRGITEEPDTLGSGRKSSHRRRSSHLSDSVRHLAQRASAAIRRDSTMSTGSIRAPPMTPGDDLPQVESAPAVFEPIDTEARGEAYSYYHDFDIPEPEPTAVQEQRAAFGPPLSIPATSATAAFLPSQLTSPASASTAAPISPVSPGGPTSQLSPLASRPTFGLGQGVAEETYDEPDDLSPATLREKRGLIDGPNGPLKRMNTQPLKPIVSDIESPPLPAKSERSVNPMDIWGPTTLPEKDHKTLVDLSTPSPPAQMEPVPNYPSQPTPDATPEPEVGQDGDGDRDMDMDEEHASPVPKQERLSPEGVSLAPPPQIAVTGGDIDMIEPSGRYTPPPSSIPSNPTTPGYMSDQYLTPAPPMTPALPGSNDGPSDHSDSSPRIYKCDYCNTEFDQYHKLNHHTRYHDRPHICPHQGCTMRFGTKTHLGRHINDKHTKSKQYFCTQRNCPYSRQGGRSFPRKDNWRRHMQNKHNIQNPADPEEVTMDGTGQPEGLGQQQFPLQGGQGQEEVMYNQGFLDGTMQTGGLLQAQAAGELMPGLAYTQFHGMPAQQGPGGSNDPNVRYS